jgi:hypothetical protein
MIPNFRSVLPSQVKVTFLHYKIRERNRKQRNQRCFAGWCGYAFQIATADVMVKVFEGIGNVVSSYLITGLNGILHKKYKIFFEGRILKVKDFYLYSVNRMMWSIITGDG